MIRRLLHRRQFAREHDWTHAHLSDYLDQDLDERERHRLEAHVSLCPQCHRVLGTLRSMLRALAGMQATPSTGLAEGIVERLREQG